ncbi:hypothetical protein I3843_09G192800 [Carya illinoinensis]|nr:hypothetical protein I3843_09G192800 [Carya illinoinensis]
MYYCTLQVCHVKYVYYMLCHVTKCFYLKLFMYFKLCSNHVMLRKGSSPFVFQSRFILSTFSLCKIHGATTTVEYVFNCIVMCRIHGATTTVEYVFTRRIQGATTTVEYVFFMLIQVSEQVHDKSSADQVHVKSSSVHVSI